MIEVRALSKVFRTQVKEPGLMGSLRSLVRRQTVERVAVDAVSFEVSEGEIVGLIGANGAGKTTLVKMLSGIVHPSSGMARVLGCVPWQRDNRFRSQIAVVMGQKAQLWWDLPAADCFLLLREIYQVPEARHRQALGELTESLGVRDQLRIPIRQLSLGERMKMELIATLLHSPRVVFLDEPTIGLDLAAQRAVREFLLRYREQHRPAMLLTSHYMEDIERLCQRIIIMRRGAVVFDGPLGEVTARFAHHKVITTHLQRAASSSIVERLAKLGDVLELTDDVLRIRVPRTAVAMSAAELLQALPVSDLNIEEEDIADLIERLLQGRDEDGGENEDTDEDKGKESDASPRMGAGA